MIDTIESRIGACLARHPDWNDERVSNAIIGARVSTVRAVRAGEPIPAAPVPAPDQPANLPAAPAGGFSLSGVALLSKKPLDCWKARFYGLESGMGYKVEDLSKQWGMSTDSVRQHAKDHNALVYVEASPGEYVACIVHPETPRGDRS